MAFTLKAISINIASAILLVLVLSISSIVYFFYKEQLISATKEASLENEINCGLLNKEKALIEIEGIRIEKGKELSLNMFYDNTTTKDLVFENASSQPKTYVRLPKNAIIVDAYVDLQGKKY